MEKIRIAEKSLLDQFCTVLDPLQRHIFFFAKIPYFNYQLNFQSSHLTKKETEDAFKRLSSYCIGALNYRYITLAIMKYHIMLARNNGICELAGSRSPCFLDDFNEQWTAVIVKKKLARQFFIRYYISAPTWLQWFNTFINLSLSEIIKKKRFWELFPFCNEGVWVRNFT